jgi:hypothetical protein
MEPWVRVADSSPVAEGDQQLLSYREPMGYGFSLGFRSKNELHPRLYCSSPLGKRGLDGKNPVAIAPGSDKNAFLGHLFNTNKSRTYLTY